MRRLASLLCICMLGACASGKPSLPGEASGQVGMFESSSEPTSLGVLTPIDVADPATITHRGRLLHAMQRALELAHRQAFLRLAASESALVVPVVDIDPGGRSGQVFYATWRHEDVPDKGLPDTSKARRYAVVSLVLAPERVLDIEQLAGRVEKDGAEHRRLFILLLASAEASKLAPKELFDFFVVYEQTSKDASGAGPMRGRVYAFAAELGGPDMEIVVDGVDGPEPKVVATIVHHELGGVRDHMIRTPLASPGPMTVARVLGRTSHAKVEVMTSSGRFFVTSSTGYLERSEF